MNPNFGVAVIGTGKWGINHVRVANQLLGERLRYACDISERSLRNVKKVAPSVATTINIDEVLADEAVEAVIISSGAETHYDIGKKCIQAGKHCLIEKPLTLHSQEAVELIQMADQAGVILMVGHLLLYHPAVRAIREEVNAGNLGQILYLYSQRVNLGTIRRKENAFWSLAPHDISVMLYLTDQQPVSISAIGGEFIAKNMPDVVFYHLNFDKGLLAHGHVSWLDPHKMRNFTIVGSKKMIIFDDMKSTGKLAVFDKGVGLSQSNGDVVSMSGVEEMQLHGASLIIRDGDIVLPKIPTVEPLRVEQQHFFSCIEKKLKPLTDGQSGLQVLRIMEAAQLSLERGGTPVLIERNSDVKSLPG